MGQPQDDQVTLGDKNVETSQFDRYKGAKDRKDRIAVISTKLVRAYRYYHPASQRSFRAPTNAEMLKHCKEQLGEPEQRFGMVLFHYNTDNQGNLVDEAKCQGKVKIWVISEARYEELSNLHKKWPLLDQGFAEKQVDLEITCKEEKFQRMEFVPCPSAHWKSKEAWYKALKDKEARAQEKVRMALGRQLTDAEIMELLGGMKVGTPTGGVQNAGEVDLSEVLDE